jgi:hypothetical protein
MLGAAEKDIPVATRRQTVVRHVSHRLATAATGNLPTAARLMS